MLLRETILQEHERSGKNIYISLSEIVQYMQDGFLWVMK